jgi:hypothetical protein
MAGYRTWTNQDRLDGPDLNSYLMGQSVCRFANATQRDQQMGGVVPGQVSYLVDGDRFERVRADGSWGPLLPMAGTVGLTGSSTTVTCPAITDTAVILLTIQQLGTVSSPSLLAVESRSAASGTFTISASDSADSSTVGWLLVESST